MFKFSLSVMALCACLFAPMGAMALELTQLHLPMTRAEADATLSKDYSYSVLEDMTVRRTWSLQNREVSVDFAPKQGDKALLIFIDYDSPVSTSVAANDASQLTGGAGGKWKRLNASRSARLGMQNPEGLKVEGGRFCFRALNKQGRVTRLAYFADVPKEEIRWELAKDDPQSGVTAMGTRGGGSTEFLWKDEELRHAKPLAEKVDDALESPVAEDSHADSADEPEQKRAELRLDDDVQKPLMDTIMEYAKAVDPLYYGIALAVVVVLVALRALTKAREAKRRKMVADYIMKRGKIALPGKKRKR